MQEGTGGGTLCILTRIASISHRYRGRHVDPARTDPREHVLHASPDRTGRATGHTLRRVSLESDWRSLERLLYSSLIAHALLLARNVFLHQTHVSCLPRMCIQTLRADLPPS